MKATVAVPVTPASDAETRARVLMAATRLFAARGFKDVTVREICQEARANVAAVNYHFGDKAGLYQEVIQTAIATMQETTTQAREAGVGEKPAEQLRHYIRTFLHRVSGATHDAWIHQLMTWEMADPTPALDLVLDRVVRPRFAYVGQMVAAILRRPEDDPVVTRAVLSIQAQCHAAMKSGVSTRLIPDLARAEDIDLLANHIADFSLGGLKALRRQRIGRSRADRSQRREGRSTRMSLRRR